MPERDMRGLELALISPFSLPPATSLSQKENTLNSRFYWAIPIAQSKKFFLSAQAIL
jgi:hypothetical protein